MDKFIVEVDRFKGPLEVLLDLIDKRKLSINEISLSKIADEFICFSKKVPQTIKQLTEFVEISSILVLIKAKSLIPNFKTNEKEQEDIQELQNRLKAYKLLKSGISKIKPAKLYKPKRYQVRPINFIEDENVSIYSLLMTAYKILDISKIPDIPQAKIKKRISLKEAQSKLEKELLGGGDFLLDDLIKRETKFESITYFLALLDLIAKDKVSFVQNSGKVFIYMKDIGTPRYI